jgi:hypothetical protein
MIPLIPHFFEKIKDKKKFQNKKYECISRISRITEHVIFKSSLKIKQTRLEHGTLPIPSVRSIAEQPVKSIIDTC